MPAVNSQSCQYCYIDIDCNNHRSNLALVGIVDKKATKFARSPLTHHAYVSRCHCQTAAFVDATDSRYGFCSKDLRKLGGSELSRMHELMSNDHGELIRNTSIELFSLFLVIFIVLFGM